MVILYYIILNTSKLDDYLSHYFKVTIDNNVTLYQNGNNDGSALSTISAKLLSSSVNL